jgi:hypothetical protein
MRDLDASREMQGLADSSLRAHTQAGAGVWRQLVVPSCISDQSPLRASRASENPIHFLFDILLLLYSFSWIVERPWRMAVSYENPSPQL